MWESIHPSICDVARSIAESGNFDDAIFAAFRFTEGEIQERISSKNIGQNLLDEAFDGPTPKIMISSNIHDREGVKKIFSGAFSFIRNDRGHKKSPAVPCKTIGDCLLYLYFASFLLYLLDKDINMFPRIHSIRIFGSYDQPRAEIRGANFGRSSKVLAVKNEVDIVRINQESIEIILPSKFVGNIKLYSPSFSPIYNLHSISSYILYPCSLIR